MVSVGTARARSPWQETRPALPIPRWAAGEKHGTTPRRRRTTAGPRGAYLTAGGAPAPTRPGPPAGGAGPATAGGRPPIRSDRAPAAGVMKIGIAVHGRVRTP